MPPKHLQKKAKSGQIKKEDEEPETASADSESDSDEQDGGTINPGKDTQVNVDEEEDIDEELKRTIEEETKKAAEALKQGAGDTVSGLKTLRSINSLFQGNFQDLLPQVLDRRKFIVCGESLLCYALGMPGLSMSGGGQTLHVIYIIEKFLMNFVSRGLDFDIVFFEVAHRSWSVLPALHLTRDAVYVHFLKNQKKFNVLSMPSLWSIDFQKYLTTERPNFVVMATSSPKFLRQSPKWLEGIILAQSVYCDFICLDVVDIASLHSTPASLMATVFIHVNEFQMILKQVQHLIRDLEDHLPSLQSFSFADVSTKPTVRVAATVGASISLLKDNPCPENIGVVKIVLLAAVLLEKLPLKLRCFKNLPPLPTHVNDILIQLQEKMAYYLCDQSRLTKLDLRSVGDIWQGTFFSALYLALSSVEEKGSSDFPVTVKEDYQKLVDTVSNFIHCKDLTPFPIQVSGGLLKPTTESLREDLPLGPLIQSSCKLTKMFTGTLGTFVDFSVELPHPVVLESHHWHSKNELTDEFERIHDSSADSYKEENKRYSQSKRNQIAKFYTIYGLSLEGRSEAKPIVTCREENERKQKTSYGNNSKQGKHLSKKDKIIQENIKKKNEEKEKKLKERFGKLSSAFASLSLKGEYESAVEKCDTELLHVSDFPQMELNILFLKAEAAMKMWSDEVSKNRPERNLIAAQELFLTIRRIFSISEAEGVPIALDVKQKEKISSWLYELGFHELASMKHLPPPKRKLNNNCAVGMNHVEFQLRHLGSELIRDTGGKPDPRAEGFIPDPWQVKLFDIIDKKQSAVVVAPTSSGKTYASYYCIEKVIRSSDDSKVVYVCPTKALVNQVYATIYARFKKQLPPGKTLFGIFTRDFRQSVMECQILTTVPECLELLLLSPRCQSWAKRLKYVIFDEVHCLMGQAGGLSWENSLLLIRCPFLALSATIHKPELFCSWLQKIEDFKRCQSEQFGLSYRPMEECKVNLVEHYDRHNHLLKHVALNDGTISRVHPYSFLNFEANYKCNRVPKHISLSPDEAIELYDSLKKILQPQKVAKLHPMEFFNVLNPSGFLSLQAVKKYSDELRKLLEEEEQEVQIKVLRLLRTVPFDDLKTGNAFILNNFISLMDSLRKREMVPALSFSYNRMIVEALPLILLRHFRRLDNFTEDELTESDESSEPENTKAGNKKPRRKNRKKRRKLGLMRGPSMLRSVGSLRGEGHTDDKLVDYIEHRLVISGHRCTSVFPSLLRRGLGKHHGGMNNRLRSAVEMLFRLKVLNLVTATGTLALGIHMPCKTVVICGDSPFLNSLEYSQMSGRAGRRGFDKEGHVIFFGVNRRKMETLMTANLPEMRGNFPLSVSLILRLLLMVGDSTLDGKRSPEASYEALVRAHTLLENSLLYEFQPELKARMKHFFTFVIQFLIRLGLISNDGCPVKESVLLTHLHYHDPGNFAFFYLLKTGALEKLCVVEKNGSVTEQSLLDLMVVLNFLFARLPLRTSMESKKFDNSVVVLPKLPGKIEEVLGEYNQTVLMIFSHYFLFVANDITKAYGEETSLPLSEYKVQPDELLPNKSFEDSNVMSSLLSLCASNNICSAFASLSGITDKDLFPRSGEIHHIRDDLNVKVIPTIELNFECNSYAYDFFKHGIARAIIVDNGLRSGEDFKLIKDFMLVLKSIQVSLSEIRGSDSVLVQAISKISDIFSANFNQAYSGAV